MDNFNDNLDVAGVVKTASDIRHSLLVNAKRKKAQKISDQGGYNTLTAYQKSLIPVPEYAKTQAQTIAAATGQAAATVEQELKEAAPSDISTGQVKKYLPYIVGILAIGLIVWSLSKK